MTESTGQQPTDSTLESEPATDPTGLQNPDSPLAVFRKVEPWATQFLLWSVDVEACFQAQCGTDARRKSLVRLVDSFRDWTERAYEWALEVDRCYERECGPGIEYHEKPPRPPFPKAESVGRDSAR